MTGWIVIDIDATVILASSKKGGAAATFKKAFGFHALAAWCANTQESLAMLLRPGNACSNTVADHLDVLADALRQIPDSSRAKILVRVDGAGATHEVLEHLEKLNTVQTPSPMPTRPDRKWRGGRWRAARYPGVIHGLVSRSCRLCRVPGAGPRCCPARSCGRGQFPAAGRQLV
jgi:hypothetical protein